MSGRSFDGSDRPKNQEMSVEDTEPIDSLVTTGKKVNNLVTALDGLSDVNNDDKNRLTNELQRFQLWAVNLGLYHGGHSSLDYRFRDSPPLFKYAYKLLRDLEAELSQCVYSSSLPRRNKVLTG
jgi:hypothetical protein